MIYIILLKIPDIPHPRFRIKNNTTSIYTTENPKPSTEAGTGAMTSEFTASQFDKSTTRPATQFDDLTTQEIMINSSKHIATTKVLLESDEGKYFSVNNLDFYLHYKIFYIYKNFT